VILYKEASSPAVAAKWKEVHDLVVDGMSLADAMAKSPETFRAFIPRWCRRAKTGGFLDVVLGKSPIFNRAKRNESKCDDGDDLSVHPALPRAGGPHDIAGIFYSEIPEGFQQRSRFAAR